MKEIKVNKFESVPIYDFPSDDQLGYAVVISGDMDDYDDILEWYKCDELWLDRLLLIVNNNGVVMLNDYETHVLNKKNDKWIVAGSCWNFNKFGNKKELTKYLI